MVESVTGAQEWLGALLAGRVAAVGRGRFFPSRLSDPAVLQRDIGHHRHQSMAMESGP
jgi:hypothetical protein